MKQKFLTRKEYKNKLLKSFITISFMWIVVLTCYLVLSHKTLHPSLPQESPILLNTQVNEAVLANDMSIYHNKKNYQNNNHIYYVHYKTVDNALVLENANIAINEEGNELYHEAIAKLTFNIQIENVNDIQKEKEFFYSKIGNKFSEQIKPIKQENYWLAASYDSNSGIATYDIPLYLADIDMANPNYQEVIKYLEIDAFYDINKNYFNMDSLEKTIYLPQSLFRNIYNENLLLDETEF